ncbi:choline dehydrogenase [Palleronia aestuarii]|uniref:choline dehydrogenase n=1 Tax=Palleronia aestuarii TaxID=568105 RepID=UPI000DADB9A3|nr:choline dehydrogenase [Palleronia aestuarii]
MEIDYVVVGAGSAGCAVAYRLAEAGHSVVVVEDGGSDWGPLINMPGALSFPMNMPRYDWGYRSEPEPHLGDRRLACPRGRVIGGSSSINGMVYVRGHPGDYATWERLGAKGWGFADVLPYFKRMEQWHDGGHGGDPEWRGRTGPLHISRGTRDNPLVAAFEQAGAQAGYAPTPDYNGARQEGVGPMEATIWRGRRWSAAKAYLRPALATKRCRLVRGRVERVEIVDGRARGIVLKKQTVRARREVILSAGAINSPQLLMLSGIGPGAHLAERGIEVAVDRPGVGGNLQDHLELYVQMRASKPVSLFRHWGPIGRARVALLWALAGRGPGASNQFETCAFLRSAPGVPYPDIQIHFLPLAVRYDGKMIAPGHGFQAHVGPMRSPSRGTVRLRDGTPAGAPEIRFNYMSTDEDWRDFRAAIRLTREIFAQPAIEAFSAGELLPGAEVASDDDLDAVIRDHAESAYHPCGTCRMGMPDDPGAVVDPDCRVIGVEGLRVVDSSIFPQVTNGNLNGPSIMVGEKASDHILGRRLPRDAAEPWEHPAWRTAQR